MVDGYWECYVFWLLNSVVNRVCAADWCEAVVMFECWIMAVYVSDIHMRVAFTD
jgi:hypothetical protein